MVDKAFLAEHPRIVVDPEILNGVPVIKGTRIPVCVVLEMLEGGLAFDQILRQYPSLTREDLQAALHFSSCLAAHP